MVETVGTMLRSTSLSPTGESSIAHDPQELPNTPIAAIELQIRRQRFSDAAAFHAFCAAMPPPDYRPLQGEGSRINPQESKPTGRIYAVETSTIYHGLVGILCYRGHEESDATLHRMASPQNQNVFLETVETSTNEV